MRNRARRKHLLPVFAVLLIIYTLLPNIAFADDILPDTLGFKRVPTKAGDRCIVCDGPVGKNGFAIIYKGRRVAIRPEYVKDFFENPDKYFPKLQPKGALIQEKAILESGIGYSWLLFGIWVVLALIAASIASNIALRKGFSPLTWYFIGLITSLIGVIIILFKPTSAYVDLPGRLAKIPSTPQPITCTKCGKENHPTASQCIGCGAKMQPQMESEVARVGLS